MKYGFEYLTDNELLAIILRTGTREKNVLLLAQEIINHFGGIENLSKVTFKSLLTIKGIGTSKSLEILSCLELAKRIKTIQNQKKYSKIIWPEDVFNLVHAYFQNLIQEHFYLLLLNNQNKLIHQNLLYKGTNDTLKIDAKDMLHLALIHKSNKVICIHNHPSGDSEPSLSDLHITEEIKSNFKILNITLLDHIIIGRENYYSINLNKKYYKIK
ncbi:DNA repair protein RadC [Spiroplasma sp. AdecLV25b]|uniref:RadC family protein n=1 Tax=Spiroplasma sp. AdecLV25b TaxID=3027162 RepID=UPI0027DF9A95|nr:DNA repair protein RadC [Spiroplasma sp. AdecLV25b]